MSAHSLIDSVTEKLLRADRERLEQTALPVVTVSASFRDVVEAYAGFADNVNHPDVTLSRAHYSMALAAVIAAWGGDVAAHKKAWVVDPTNYVQAEDWGRVAFTEQVGKVLARHSLLEWLKKTFLDRQARKKFPLADSLTPPLLHLTENVNATILSFHIVAGNILAQAGKRVVQVVTDPHVREDYVQFAHLPTMTYAVFDEKTRYDFLELAAAEGKEVDPQRVVVTGPPVDPRVILAGSQKRADSWRRRPLRVLLTTGGLGTNKDELDRLLVQLLPETRRTNRPIQLLYYAGTNADHGEMVRARARQAKVAVGRVDDRRARLRLLEGEDIVEANRLLLQYGLPWADVVITKPSGDMAYDAAAAGCAQLFLSPWGVWEENVRAVFTQLGTGRVADTKHIVAQLREITDPDLDKPWLESALEKTHTLPPEFTRGIQNILALVRRTL